MVRLVRMIELEKAARSAGFARAHQLNILVCDVDTAGLYRDRATPP